MEKVNQPSSKKASQAANPPPPAKPPASTPASGSAPKTPPLFRSVDWITFLIVTLVVFLGYYLTIAPEVTLEDSGELATGSFYAGIPHPPGYPVWTIYTWIWTKILPFHNVAWRVAVGEAFAGAVASGLLAILVSRSSSMMIEGIAGLKDFDRKWENAVCAVSGFVAGMLLGFNGFMWSQSVIVEVYSFSLVSLMGVLLCLMRWVYAPYQYRYLCLAFFLHGICFNNHQSLLVAAMGMELAVIAADKKMGREMLFWNVVVYLGGLVASLGGMTDMLSSNGIVFVIYNVIGILSAGGWVWLAILTKMRWMELARNLSIVLALAFLALLFGVITHFITKLLFIPLTDSAPTLVILTLLLIGAGVLCFYTIKISKKFSYEWLGTLGCGGSWIIGAAFYLYMPIAGMTCPPMQWGYPRTVEGFFHALTRGQYDRIHPTTGSGETAFDWVYNFATTYAKQMWMYFDGMNDEFNLVYLLIPLMVFLFYRMMQKRERAWLLGIGGIYIFLGPFLVWLLAPGLDKQSIDLNRVFFTAGHTQIALAMGLGMTLIATYMATHYQKSRLYAIVGSLVAADIALFTLAVDIHGFYGTFGNQDETMYILLRVLFSVLALACLALIIFRLFIAPGKGFSSVLSIITLSFVCLVCIFTTLPVFLNTDTGIEKNTAIGVAKMLCWVLAGISVYLGSRIEDIINRRIMYSLGGVLAVISAGTTLVAILGDTFSLDRLGIFFGLIGKSFNPGQYANPVYADLIVLGLTLVFLASLYIWRTRAPLALTLGLFTAMPLFSVLSHWAANEQHEHWFGYWFGHDMFTPPFEGPDGKFSYDAKIREQMMKDPVKGKLVYPEMTRDAILYGGTDPGRFCPTYMIFCDSFIPRDCRPAADPAYDRRDVYIITQNALADGTYMNYIRSHYNRSTQIDPPFFQELLRGPTERTENYETNIIASMAYSLLDKPLTKLGADIEARRRREGVYPPKEMYIASPEDSAECFNAYMMDANRRMQSGQLKPGEDVKNVGGKMQVSGQAAVMAINGLLTKVMFDHNPTNEFFVEESFPLDWMYPHLTPFGVIMKINREPLASLSETDLERDHAFWSKYSERLIGNWITYDTPVKDVVDFIDRVYLHHDYSTYKGDRKFIRDDQAQKAFSKLRSSIGGIYAWRISSQSPPEYRPKNPAELQRVAREADFAFKQAFAFCPFSPEAVFRYVNVLLQFNRLDDAMLVAQTCLQIDPNNGAAADLVHKLGEFKKNTSEVDQARANLAKQEEEVRKNPSNYQAVFNLASAYAQMQQPAKAEAILDRILNDPQVPIAAVVAAAQGYMQMNNAAGFERALKRLTQMAPNEPEAWFDLAAFESGAGKHDECIADVAKAVQLNSERLAKDPKAHDILADFRSDPRFNPVRNLPEFQKLVPPQ